LRPVGFPFVVALTSLVVVLSLPYRVRAMERDLVNILIVRVQVMGLSDLGIMVLGSLVADLPMVLFHDRLHRWVMIFIWLVIMQIRHALTLPAHASHPSCIGVTVSAPRTALVRIGVLVSLHAPGVLGHPVEALVVEDVSIIAFPVVLDLSPQVFGLQVIALLALSSIVFIVLLE
jgi:hypothetical protein